MQFGLYFSIKSIPDMRNLFTLQRFNVKENLLNDASLFENVRHCFNLKEVLLDGNPLTKVPNYR